MAVIVCLVFALVLLLIAAFWVAPNPRRVYLQPLGLAFLTLAFLLGQGHLAL